MTPEALLTRGISTPAPAPPAFVNPQAPTGEAPENRRAALYSLGCLACGLLTGPLVLSGPNAPSIALAHVERLPGDRPSSASELTARRAGAVEGSKGDEGRAAARRRPHLPEPAAG